MRHSTILLGVTAVAAIRVPTTWADAARIRALDVTQDAEVTRVHVRSSRSPAFTVYKLERPSRVVLDLPAAQLAEGLTGHDTAMVMTPNTWAVSTVAAQQLEDGSQLVRVSITLARPGRYNVKAEGNDLIVVVTARDPAPAG
ncbi:MAG TPA: AMIN domain-containing protein, partial [Kofleriaceae bacterium]